MISGGIKMMEKVLHSLPASEEKIAEFILDNPQSVVQTTVSELAVQSNASGSAVIRLCKSLGLNGFQDLKVRIAGDLLKETNDGYRDIEEGETVYSIVKKVANNSIQSIKETEEMVNYEDLNRAISLLVKAKTIHFFGIGASHIIAQDAQQKLLRINKNATAFLDTHLVSTLIANAGNDDVLFGISHSGETEEVIKVMSLAKKKGLKTITLTKFGPSPVSTMGDINLFTSFSSEATFRSGATSSRLAQLYMLDILFLNIVSAEYEKSIQYIDNTRAAICDLKKKEAIK